ncbi:O-antigen/teichoic acid export membrane protein [Azospirillum fermentarium]|uniref:oligosaccharide flippase family protein n=1 Tax=Azospirillum fermentarium TaxID=1233114 RepID=UPI002225F020|nr:oligosaccharide flippase family protein [Azospirillum fermentarium]MCW2247453.1 O-antigen/teichoic acid export membrane protein [Azospirillum fermentarium]
MRSHLYSVKALRRGLVSLLFGRFLSAGLTMLAMVMVARHLDIPSFGVYALLLSTLGLAITYTSLGMDWVSARYLPEYRIHAAASDLRRFLTWFVGVRAASLAVFSAAVLAGAAWTAAWLDIGGQEEVFRLYIAVTLLEGLVRSLRGDVFEPLLMQVSSQSNAALRAVVFAGLVGWGIWDGGLTLAWVVMADLAASALSLVVAFGQLGWFMAHALKGHERSPGWTPPPFRQMLAVGWHNYLAQVINGAASPNALMLVGTSMAGPAALAGFGFCRTFADQLRRYLPITLLIPLARPKIVASFAVDNDYGRLKERVQFLYKANLIVLMPAVILAAAFGDDLLAAISGGKYGDAWAVAVGFTLFLVLQSHRVVLSLLTNILNCPELTSAGSVASVAALPLAVAALWAGWGAEGLVGAMLLGEALSHIVIIAMLGRRGYAYGIDAGGYARLGLAAAASVVLTLLLPAPTGIVEQTAVYALPVALFAVLTLVLWPFTPFERGMIQRFIGTRRLMGRRA